MLPQRQRIAALAAALALTLTACGEATDDSGGSPTGSAPTTPQDGATSAPDDGSTSTPSEEDSMRTNPVPLPEPGDSALPTGPVPDSVLERPEVVAATEDYAKRMNVGVEDVTVEGFASVTWSDGSLGCPEPGMMYTQALVPGYQLVLGVDGRLASYHSAEGKPFSYCASPVPPAQTNPST